MSAWSVDNPVFNSYIFWSAVLAAKVLVMGPITGYYRISRKAFANPEDALHMGAKDTKTNPEVERVRRAHQNDLENIPVFWVAGLFYVLTNPSPFTAYLLFRAFSAARILHTLLYLGGSPYRGMAFFLGTLVNFFIVGNVLYSFY
ncbi:microsomal glutathione S-transferase 1-like [Homarus americanus]|uniref:Microsomal glutathione S-transferase 1-like n=1 Tax=Homarus americanus TaxID=6706 RepID=A0A8J5NAL8_HOMAM|nr:microsomal glutathione S-transferase 1-like [Homarus americanus]KAG7176023.1 Microsomal glutathione S-transferase 1-like [Homarus americanus]